MPEQVEGVFVQRQMTVSPPVSTAVLRTLLAAVPDDACVEILDGELIDVRWERHEPEARPTCGDEHEGAVCIRKPEHYLGHTDGIDKVWVRREELVR